MVTKKDKCGQISASERQKNATKSLSNDPKNKIELLFRSGILKGGVRGYELATPPTDP